MLPLLSLLALRPYELPAPYELAVLTTLGCGLVILILIVVAVRACREDPRCPTEHSTEIPLFTHPKKEEARGTSYPKHRRN